MKPFDFEPGDVVQAVIDGRKMTVVIGLDTGQVICQWLDRNQQLQQASFNAARLRKVDAP